MRAALERSLGGPVTGVELRRSPYSTSHPIDFVAATLCDGTRQTLLRKDLSPHALLPEAAGVRPNFLQDPLREIEVYRRILSPALGTAHCVGAVVDEPAGRYWLFLEQVQAVELWQAGELETWASVARWLAQFHERRLHETAPRDAAARLVRYDRAYYRRWPRRALMLASSRRHELQTLASCHDELVRRLLSLPVTFVHGELVASNVLVGPEGRVCPVDWESAGIGPGLIDLAALVSGWPEGEVRALAEAYRRELTPSPPPDELMDALDACRLHLCLRWLGWAPAWRPPSEHARDWLTEAMTLARRTGLL